MPKLNTNVRTTKGERIVLFILAIILIASLIVLFVKDSKNGAGFGGDEAAPLSEQTHEEGDGHNHDHDAEPKTEEEKAAEETVEQESNVAPENPPRPI